MLILMNKAIELGTKDGVAAKAKVEKRGRVFTGLGAAKASGDAFMRRMDKGVLAPADVVDYGTAFINAAAS